MPCHSTKCASKHDELEIGGPECVRMVACHELCFSSHRSDPDSERFYSRILSWAPHQADSGELEAISEPPVMVLIVKAKLSRDGPGRLVSAKTFLNQTASNRHVAILVRGSEGVDIGCMTPFRIEGVWSLLNG